MAKTSKRKASKTKTPRTAKSTKRKTTTTATARKSTQRSAKNNSRSKRTTTKAKSNKRQTIKVKNPVVVEANSATYETICSRAYEIWLRKGCPPGQDQENWLEAERELQSV